MIKGGRIASLALALGTGTLWLIPAAGSAGSAASGSVRFSAVTYTAHEGSTAAAITVERVGGASGAGTVDYSTRDGSATAGNSYDYAATSGTLRFDDGQTSATFEVPIRDDNEVEPRETVRLDLTNESGLGPDPRDVATLEVLDNEGLAYAVTATDELFSFPPSEPATTSTPVPVTGLAAGERLHGIDFRAQTDELYGLGSSSRLYTVDLATGVATAVGQPGGFTLSGTRFGFDFIGRSDRIRVVSDAGQNLRLDADDGTLISTDDELIYPSGDLGFGATPRIAAAAYTEGYQYGGTLLYEIDAGGRDAFVTQEEYFDPTRGVLHTIGSLGTPVGDAALDIYRGRNHPAFAAITPPGGSTSTLYTIDLESGKAADAGAIDVAEPVTGIALAPAGQLALAGPVTASEEDGVATVTIERTGGTFGRVTAWMYTVMPPHPDLDFGSGVVVLEDGQSTTTFEIGIRDNPFPNKIEYILVIAERGGGVWVNPQDSGSRTRLTVRDTDLVQDKRVVLSGAEAPRGDVTRVKLDAKVRPCFPTAPFTVVEFQAKERGSSFESFQTMRADDDCRASTSRRIAGPTVFRAKSPATSAFHAAASNRVRATGP